MLKRGFLASNLCYLSIAHSDEIFEKYSKNLDEVFKLITKCEDGYNINNLLEYPLCHNGFERLN